MISVCTGVMGTRSVPEQVVVSHPVSVERV